MGVLYDVCGRFRLVTSAFVSHEAFADSDFSGYPQVAAMCMGFLETNHVFVGMCACMSMHVHTRLYMHVNLGRPATSPLLALAPPPQAHTESSAFFLSNTSSALRLPAGQEEEEEKEEEEEEEEEAPPPCSSSSSSSS